jgi:hypothetical protein
MCGAVPTPAVAEASTPVGRDGAIDVIRIVSLIGVVAAATLASVGWGLLRVAVALVGARRLAGDRQRVCAASRPARMT